MPYKYAVSCHQSVLIRDNNAEQNLCPYMYIRTNQSVSILSAIRQQTVGKLTTKLNANKEPELINYSKKTRKSNEWNPRNSKLEEKWIRIREMNSQKIVQEHADDWKWLHLPSSSFTGPHLDSGQQNLEETPSHVAKKQFQPKGWSRPLDLNADHAHLQTIGRSVCCHICVYPAHGRTNPTNQPRPHIIIVKRTIPRHPRWLITHNWGIVCNHIHAYRWQNGPTSNQQTNLLEWSIPWRIATIVEFIVQRRWRERRKTIFPMTFLCTRYSPLVVFHSRLLKLWC